MEIQFGKKRKDLANEFTSSTNNFLNKLAEDEINAIEL